MTIEYQGETFAGYNKPKRTANHPEKSHAVLAKVGETIRLIRFGAQGVSGSPPKAGEGESDKSRRDAFFARHKQDIQKGKLSAAYWAYWVKWTNRYSN